MEIQPIDNPFGKFLKGPLTADDIAELDEGVNILLCDLFPEGEDRDDALADDLFDKIGD